MQVILAVDCHLFRRERSRFAGKRACVVQVWIEQVKEFALAGALPLNFQVDVALFAVLTVCVRIRPLLFNGDASRNVGQGHVADIVLELKVVSAVEPLAVREFVNQYVSGELVTVIISPFV